jgi:protocatechuate 3,4-dioxygenase beta subunit
MLGVVTLSLALSLGQGAPASTGRVSGRVTGDADAPVSGARVIVIPTARPTGPMGMPPQALTDQDGRFVFLLAPGEYRVDVQKTGYAPATDPMTGPRPLTVEAGQSVEVDFHIQKGAVIAGRVLDSSGEPLTDMRVMAMRRMPSRGGGVPARLVPAPMQGPQQTNDLGEFRVTGLAPGEYYVAAMRMSAMGFGGAATTPAAAGGARTTYAPTFYPSTLDDASAHAITAAAGADVGNIVIIMQTAPAFRVSGVVVDENGNPVGRAMVMLMGDPGGGMFLGPAGNAQTQDDGRFVIGDVPAGTYRVTATVIMTNLPGGVSGGAFTSFSIRAGGGGMEPPALVVVADADVKGVRVVTRRRTPP